eukprot:TRINITY_DN2137_c0_g1_i18.p1 TRINITY_DN2137_c0_g1~~TRINITY_DN2137_c0_g1_i18.p1  ORF type:complete len:186 (-),score=40.00 TRINITY_DN2137_c0_g1_i18:12-569(-)
MCIRDRYQRRVHGGNKFEMERGVAMYQADLSQPFYQQQQAPTANHFRKEIGDEAVWTLSSAKPGNGVDQLRDDNPNTFWQSDGTQPHLVTIQFLKKVRIQELAIYLDFKSDESYTPNKISIRAGINLQDLKEILYVELKEPIGWFVFPLKTKLLDGSEKPYVNTCLLYTSPSPRDRQKSRMPSSA